MGSAVSMKRCRSVWASAHATCTNSPVGHVIALGSMRCTDSKGPASMPMRALMCAVGCSLVSSASSAWVGAMRLSIANARLRRALMRFRSMFLS